MLNLKKGLPRLFIFGLLISILIGFALMDRKGLVDRNIYYGKVQQYMKQELANPTCTNPLVIGSKEIAESDPKFRDTCFYVSLYWERILDKSKKIDKSVDIKLVSEIVESERSSGHWEKFLFDIGVYVVGYVFLFLLFMTMFFIGRWVYRGFKQ